MLTEVDNGRVRDVTIQGPEIHGTYTNGGQFNTYAPNDPTLVQRLYGKGVQITARPQGDNVPWFVSLLVSWLPFIALIGVWIFLSRQMQGAGGKALGFGKSRAKLLTEAHGRVTFEDVAGVDEAKQDLQEIVEFLRDPGKFQRLGGKIPRGVLLVGPPGTGKTLIARAVAGEANVPFFTISGSDFVEMFVGVGASRVRDMFEQAKKNAPCIIFIDEIDAVGRHRGAGLGGGNDEREQTLNQLLVEMDGFEANEGIILIAATNRPDVLDPALLRPGRFDRQVIVPNPDVGRPRADPEGARAQGAARARREPAHHRARHAGLLRRGPGEPDQRGGPDGGAAQQAHGHAGRVRGRQGQGDDGRRAQVAGHDRGGEAADRLSRGRTRDRRAQRQGDRSGAQGDHHSARPRARHGDAAARARQALDERRADDLAACHHDGRARRRGADLRSRTASRPAHPSDIEQATKLARMMVTRWGLSEELGTVAYGENQEEVFLGYSVSRQQNISEATAQKIDAEIRRLVEAGYAEATKILTEKRTDLETLAKGLLEFETLSGDEIKDLLAGKRPVRELVIEPTTPRSSAVPSAGKGRPPRPDAPLDPQPAPQA